MPIQGLNFTDEEIKGALAGKTPDQIAQLAQQYGLNQSQIQQATQIGGQNYSAADIAGYAQNNGMNFGGQGGALQTLQQPAAPAAPAAGTGQGMNIPGYGWASQSEIQNFLSKGGDPNQFLQQHGNTNLSLNHELATQARGMAGSANPTGEAAMKNAWENYKKYNPNGAHANNYAGFVSSQNPGTADAIRAGTYTGSFHTQTDFQPGGIYAPGTGHDFTYQQSGQGARGMGDGWNPGAAPLNTSPQSSQPMQVNPNGALVYKGTGTSTAPTPGSPGWVQPPQGVPSTGSNPATQPSQTTPGSSLVGSGGSSNTPTTPGGGGALSQVNPYQHIYRPDQQGPWMNYHSDGQPSGPPVAFNPQPQSSFYSALQSPTIGSAARSPTPVRPPRVMHDTTPLPFTPGALTQSGT